jgi:hypothetical protein
VDGWASHPRDYESSLPVILLSRYFKNRTTSVPLNALPPVPSCRACLLWGYGADRGEVIAA